MIFLGLNVTSTLQIGGVEDYIIKTLETNELGIAGQKAGNAAILDLFTNDGDGTDDLRFQIFGVGTIGLTASCASSTTLTVKNGLITACA